VQLLLPVAELATEAAASTTSCKELVSDSEALGFFTVQHPGDSSSKERKDNMPVLSNNW
jgi:hypothetical protein